MPNNVYDRIRANQLETMRLQRETARIRAETAQIKKSTSNIGLLALPLVGLAIWAMSKRR